MKVEFGDLWPELERRLLARARRSLSYHDAQDLTSEYSVHVWSHLEAGPEWASQDHSIAYFLKAFRWRILDFIKVRQRRQEILEGFDRTEPDYDFPFDKIEVHLLNAEDPIPERVWMRMRGHTLSEIAKQNRSSIATESRRLSEWMELKKQDIASRI